MGYKSILAVFLALLFCSVICQDKTKEQEEAEKHTAEVFDKMGLRDINSMSKEKFRQFVRMLLDRDGDGGKASEDPKKNSYIERILDKLTKDMSDEVDLESMGALLDEKNMLRIVEEVNREVAQSHTTEGKVDDILPTESNSDL